MFANIPAELKELRQWVCWRYTEREGKQTKVPYNVYTGGEADVTNPATWFSFTEVVRASETGWYSGIGVVLTDNDPYAFIDLDVPKCPQDELAAEYERQNMIYAAFNSYSERSPSGNGLHIIVKGSIPTGVKRSKSGVELYSSHRYMTMTGNVFNPAPIEDRDELLNTLYYDLKKVQADGIIVDNVETRTDDDVVAAALAASNGDKFKRLLYGHWSDEYPSQSEADQAFCNMLAFYSRNREQTLRIWLRTALGQRKKAERIAYQNYTINRAFDQMTSDISFEEITEKAKAEIRKKKSQKLAVEIAAEFAPPPGLLGDVAKFIYDAAPYPLPRIALAGAIGFLSGMTGRAYNIGGVGINKYVLLLAPTSSGKEAMASGIAKLLASMDAAVPAARDFYGIDDISSGQALYRKLKERSCFLSVQAEFGAELEALTAPNAPSPTKKLKRAYLDLYTKSGKGQFLGESAFADKTKDTGLIEAPTLSLLCESVPDGIYSALDEKLVEDGFLARFTLIECETADRKYNPNSSSVQPSAQLTAKLAELASVCLGLNHSRDGKHHVIDIKFTEESAKLDEEYRYSCREKSLNEGSEGVRQLWTRAHLKARKLAGIVAVGVNYITPVVTPDVLQWAIAIVDDGVNRLSRRFMRGEIGGGDARQVADLRKILRKYLNSDTAKITRSGATAQLHSEGLISFSNLQRQCLSISSFKMGVGGATSSFVRIIKLFIDSGVLVEVPEFRARQLNVSGKIYAINDPAELMKE